MLIIQTLLYVDRILKILIQLRIKNIEYLKNKPQIKENEINNKEEIYKILNFNLNDAEPCTYLSTLLSYKNLLKFINKQEDLLKNIKETIQEIDKVKGIEKIENELNQSKIKIKKIFYEYHNPNIY
jgi:hypothetical protein